MNVFIIHATIIRNYRAVFRVYAEAAAVTAELCVRWTRERLTDSRVVSVRRKNTR